MDIVIEYLAVFPLTLGYAHQRFVFGIHSPLPCLCNQILSIALEIPSRSEEPSAHLRRIKRCAEKGSETGLVIRFSNWRFSSAGT
jgi:hypothetical protein